MLELPQMQRAAPFEVGECYHVYKRGVNKAEIFNKTSDWDHFQHLLYTRNSDKRIDSARVKGLPLHKIDRGETIVNIMAYACMPNHFHLLIHEKIEGGISTFMSKLSTAYSMYINIKYNRTGTLMCRPFRSQHIDSDEYFRWCVSYIHCNPLELNSGASDRTFLRTFKYSSFPDYFLTERDEATILNKEVLPCPITDLEDVTTMRKFLDDEGIATR